MERLHNDALWPQGDARGPGRELSHFQATLISHCPRADRRRRAENAASCSSMTAGAHRPADDRTAVAQRSAVGEAGSEPRSALRSSPPPQCRTQPMTATARRGDPPHFSPLAFGLSRANPLLQFYSILVNGQLFVGNVRSTLVEAMGRRTAAAGRQFRSSTLPGPIRPLPSARKAAI